MCECVCVLHDEGCPIVLSSLSASIAVDGGTIDSVLTLFLSVPLKLPQSPSNPASPISQFRADGPKRMGWD